MQEAYERTFSFPHFSLFAFGFLGVKTVCWAFINGVDFQDIFGAGSLRNMPVYILILGSSCECSLEGTVCCSSYTLPITEDLFPCCLGHIWLLNPYLVGSPGWLNSGSLGTNYEAVLLPYSLLSTAIR